MSIDLIARGLAVTFLSRASIEMLAADPENYLEDLIRDHELDRAILELDRTADAAAASRP